MLARRTLLITRTSTPTTFSRSTTRLPSDPVPPVTRISLAFIAKPPFVAASLPAGPRTTQVLCSKIGFGSTYRCHEEHGGGALRDKRGIWGSTPSANVSCRLFCLGLLIGKQRYLDAVPGRYLP